MPVPLPTGPPDGRLRRRDLLLSLKYSTIEACFSVPMLNLTMPNLPFAIAFAVVALGWDPWAIGLMAALPHWCNFLQPPLTRWLQRRFSLYQTMCLGFVLSALPWGLVPWLDWLGPSRNVVFALLLGLATLANSVTSVAWSAAIAEVVPHRISGKYFGRRNLVFGFWTLIVILAAGVIADVGHDPLLTFGWIFAAAGMARLIGLLFLTRMKFPPVVTERQTNPLRWEDFLAVFRDHNYLWLVAFIAVWGLLLNVGMPFYTMYLLDGLHFKVVDVVKLTTVASIGGLATLKGWGRLCDRFGSKPVLHVCAVLWALAGMLSWALAGPRWHQHLYVNYFVVGATTAGFQLSQFNLMVGLVPTRPAEEVWRTMRTMRSFNPLLMMGTVAEYFLTPRGLLGLTRQSLRSLRRQARALTEVGEEILEGGEEIVRATTPRRRR